MATRSVSFNEKVYKLAIDEADGRHKTPLILSDSGYEGLMIRVTARSASWYCRFRKIFYRLGDVGVPEKHKPRKAGVIYSATAADEIASRVREMVKLGQDPSDYITARALGHTHEQASATAGSIVAGKQGAWKYEELVERYINDVVAKPTKTSKGKIRPPKARSISDVRMYLMYRTTEHMHGKLIRDITKADLEKARKDAADLGKKHPQRKVVTYVKTALTWAADMYGAESGLDDVAPWWLRVKAFDTSTEREEILAAGGSVPTLSAKDVARILFMAEKHRVFPGRTLAIPTKEVTIAALWWVALTAQRTHASLSLMVSRIEDQTATRGWHLVEWLPADVKSSRFHSLPISPEIYRRTIGRALAAADRRPGSQYVFPSPKAKAKGSGPDGPEVDKPVGDTLLNSLLLSMRGKKTLLRKGVVVPATGIDLLEGVPKFSPHKFRDALASGLTELELPGGAASAVLDHADAEREEDPESRQAKVTQDHYDRSHKLGLKNRALTEWADAVLGEYKKLLDAEKVRRFGSLVTTHNGRRRTLARIAPADHWLFDRHLPDLPGQRPVVSDPSKRTLYFWQLSRGVANDVRLDDPDIDDELADVG
ncbi:hypothetical protein [Microvirga splendida]|uniref:Integrase DNA-binding domain-containing protein n=1 Tax=Microvirga splendida TaxID=2795727 RepID=A0ABS0Y0A0_9HYPH|nr:hypothetical protein [Microvirga splendida]MBJ6125430.1 hypothetical protein [Microvirga splendida]